jgi:polar amino acid transport system substrate-binding protein
MKNHRNIWHGIAGIFLLVCVSIEPIQAQGKTSQSLQQSSQKLHVATGLIKPFVIEENGKLTGFSIDLWNEISKEANLESDLAVKPNVKELLASVKSKKSDVGIAALSITADRDKEFDFSYPIYEGGLQILVLSQPAPNPFTSFVEGIFSAAFLQLIGIILVIMLIPAHIIWFLERGKEESLIPDRSYFPGIFKACWWSLSTLATQAEEMPKTPVGRVFAVIWMFTSVVFVAYFTASVTTSLTVQQLKTSINGPDDLPGKNVASIAGSTSVEYLRENKVTVTEFPRSNQAFDALLQKQVDAVVFDAPVLLYYASHEGQGKVQVVGSVFRQESYGIVFSANSPYRKRVNAALLTLKENGVYEELHKKWFGGS